MTAPHDSLRTWWTRQLGRDARAQAFVFALVATPLSWVYRGATWLRNAAYERGLFRTQRLPGAVLSVGNIAVGGTGKSPVVLALAAELQRRGYRPAILTRGYGSGLVAGDSVAMLNGSLIMGSTRDGAVALPDEGRMQSALLPGVPVVAGADRAAAARRFLGACPTLRPTHWLLDDGFQHRRLHRDVDLVVLDANRPWGNGWLLPRGRLREPLKALRRADVVLFTRATSGGTQGDRPTATDRDRAACACRPGAALLAAAFVGGAPEPLAEAGERFSPSRHAPLLLVAGIAHPEALRAELEAEGLVVGDVVAVADHAPLPREEIAARARHAAAVITTAKDYWRDPAVFAGLPRPVFIQPLTARLSAADFAAVFERLAR